MKRLTATLAVAALLAAGPAFAQDLAKKDGGKAPSGHYEKGVWVPEGNTLAEVLEQQAANRTMADFARTQVADNEARLAAHEQAETQYQADLARVAAETKANEAAAAAAQADYDRRMAEWRAAACAAGDKSQCRKD